jgi:hypothetical protein
VVSLSGLKRRHGEAIGNAAIPLRMKLHAIVKASLVRHGLWSGNNGKSAEAENSEKQAEGWEVHGFRRRKGS